MLKNQVELEDELEEKFYQESLKDELLLNKIISLTKKLNIIDDKIEISEIENLNLNKNLESVLIYYLGTENIEVRYGKHSEINDEGFLYDDSFKLFIKDASSYNLLTLEEEQELTNRYFFNKDLNAREKLINHNLRLVISTAQKFVGHGLELPDLVQEGNRGLMKAIDRFDPTKGYKLSTYSVWWIRQYIERGIHDQSRIVRLPNHLYEKLEKIKSIKKQYFLEHEKYPTDKYLQEAVGLNDEIYNKVKLFFDDVTSLDIPIRNSDDKEDSFVIDFVEDTSKYVQDIVEQKDLSSKIEEAMVNFDERSKEVIKMRFGLKPYNRTYTLEEVGKEYSVTRERIRQIETRALCRLRENTILKSLV